MARLTNVTFFNFIFGDSSAVVYYLRALGYKLAPVEQTGSNFGMEVMHEVPTLAGGRTGDDCLIATKAMVPITPPGPKGARGRPRRQARRWGRP